MLDLAFVRANLSLVEEKLRARGQDPAALLGDFHAVDAHRRERITEVEQLKAQRNKLSEDVGKLKRSGQDATALMEETRALKERMESLDAAANEADRLQRQSAFPEAGARLEQSHAADSECAPGYGAAALQPHSRRLRAILFSASMPASLPSPRSRPAQTSSTAPRLH